MIQKEAALALVSEELWAQFIELYRALQPVRKEFVKWYEPVKRYERAIIRHPDFFLWACLPLRYGWHYYRKKGESRGVLMIGLWVVTVSVRI